MATSAGALPSLRTRFRLAPRTPGFGSGGIPLRFRLAPQTRALEVGILPLPFLNFSNLGITRLNRGDRKCALHRRVPRESTPEVAIAGERFRRLRYGGHPARLLAAAQRLLGDQVRGSPRGGAGGGDSEPRLVRGARFPAALPPRGAAAARAGVGRRCPRGAAAGGRLIALLPALRSFIPSCRPRGG